MKHTTKMIKYGLFSFFSPILHVFASLSKMQEQFSTYKNATKNATIIDPRTPGLRNLQSQLGLWLSSINGYGCWCYFDGKFGKGKGEPIDELDQFCKTLQQGYECVIFKF